MFELQSVTVKIGSRSLVDDISLTVTPGRVVGLVGSNGSGKSTLIRSMARHQPLARGSIHLGERNLGDYGERELAQIIAYLPQAMPPADGLRSRELIALGRYPWHGALGRFTPNDSRAVDAAIAATGVEAFLDRPVDSLSGGERQRVWLAMAIAQESRVLLLDEPTSALDLANAVRILDLVRRLSHARDLTAVIVLHDINMAARYCDEIVALRDGRLIAQGSPETIIEPDVLNRIYGVTMQTFRSSKLAVPVAYLEA